MTWQGDVGAEVAGLFLEAQDPVVLELREAWCASQVTRYGAGKARRGCVHDASWVREVRGWDRAVERLVRMRCASPPIPRCPEAGSHRCSECGEGFASARSVLTHSWRMHGV